MKKLLSAVLLLVGLSLTGCGGNGSSNNFTPTGFFTPTPTITASSVEVNFNPLAGSLSDIPFPNDLLRNPATGQNALPGGASATSEPQASFNSLSGFSTAGDITIPFVGLIDPNTVTPADVIFEDTTTNLQVNVNLAVTTDGNGNSIIIGTPVTPLTPGHEYVVIVANGVESSQDTSLVPNPTVQLMQQSTPLVDSSGNSTVPGLSSADAQALEPIREYLQPIYLQVSTAADVPVYDLLEVFTFGTQPLFGTLQGLQTAAVAAPPTPTIETPLATLSPPPPAETPSPGAPSATPIVLPNPLTQTSAGLTIPEFIGSIAPGAPNSHIGTILFGSYTDPNYQGPPEPGSAAGLQPGSGPAGLEQFGTNNISFIVCLPGNATQTISPVPCVIFQHGITRTDFDVFAIADAICSTGQGVIAINLQLHGDRSVPGQPSGTGFIDLVSLRTSRDNIRQSVSDEDNEIAMILAGNTNFLGTGAVFGSSSVSFVGQSLGSIVGTDFTATNPQCITSVLNVPGGRLLNLLINSATFGPPIVGALQPIVGPQGTPGFEQYVQIAQTVVDDADSFNYGPHLLTRDLAGSAPVGVLMQEMIDDQVIPNSALDDLALAANITQLNATVPITTPFDCPDPFELPQQTIGDSGFVGSGLYQYTGGQHGFLLDPTEGGTDGIDTGEGQEQVVEYLSTAISNGGIGTIIVPPVPTGPLVRSGQAYTINAKSLFRRQ